MKAELSLFQQLDAAEPDTLEDIASLMCDEEPGRLFVCESCGAKRFAPQQRRAEVLSAADGWAKVHGRCAGLVGQ